MTQNKEYDLKEMYKQIVETVTNLDRYKHYYVQDKNGVLFFYDQDDEYLEQIREAWDVNATIDEIIDNYEQTGNKEAEIRYDGIKFFTQSVIF